MCNLLFSWQKCSRNLISMLFKSGIPPDKVKALGVCYLPGVIISANAFAHIVKFARLSILLSANRYSWTGIALLSLTILRTRVIQQYRFPVVNVRRVAVRSLVRIITDKNTRFVMSLYSIGCYRQPVKQLNLLLILFPQLIQFYKLIIIITHDTFYNGSRFYRIIRRKL